MSLFRRLIALLKAGGAGFYAEEDIVIDLEGEGQLCVTENENLVASLTSIATISVSTIRLVPPGLTSVYTLLAYLSRSDNTASLASAYSLSTAPI